MNDPLELQFGRQLVEHAFVRAGLPADIAARVRAQLDFAGEVMDGGRTFLLSASTNGDSLGQWNAYGGTREGFAIGLRASGDPLNLVESTPFDPSTDPDGHGDINQQVSVWRDVIYDDAGHAEQADALIDLLARLVDPVAYDPALSGSVFSELLVTAYAAPAYAATVNRLKKHHWALEEEVRIAATALDAARFHQVTPTGRTYVNLTGWTRPASITGRSTYTSPAPAPLPIVAVRTGPMCPHTDLRDLLDTNGYASADVLKSGIAYQ